MKSQITWHAHTITKEDRIRKNGFRPAILWFTGLSGAGKSTIANGVEKALFDLGISTYLLDGDNVRHGLNRDLGFSDEERTENIRRIGEVSKLFVDAGLIVLTAFISPFQKDREQVRRLVGDREFIEIFIDTPIELCEQRDPKGLYQKASAGKISDFTGISAPYEAPYNPEIHIQTDKLEINESVKRILNFLYQHEILVYHYRDR